MCCGQGSASRSTSAVSGAWANPAPASPDGPWEVIVPKYEQDATGARVRVDGFETVQVSTYTEAYTVIQQRKVGGSIRRVKAA